MRILVPGCQCEHDIEKVSLRRSVSGLLVRGSQCEHVIERVSVRMSN